MDSIKPELPAEIRLVSSVDSREFSLLVSSLGRSSIVGLDAEWKPNRGNSSSSSPTSSSSTTTSSPTVTLLQIACRIRSETSDRVGDGDSRVFVVDLLSVPPTALWEILNDVFISPHVLKLGFRFKQDLAYLSSTFSSHGCHLGLDSVEPYLDITRVYHYIKHSHTGVKLPKETKSLATICREVLGVCLSKELQCSDWSCRPLTEEQISYAAADAYYLLEIFNVFQSKFISEGTCVCSVKKVYSANLTLGLKDLFDTTNSCDSVRGTKFSDASDMVKSVYGILSTNHSTVKSTSPLSCKGHFLPDETISKIVRTYGEKLLLKDADKKPSTSRRKGRKQPLVDSKCKQNFESNEHWQGPPPWDPCIGGDGFPKFLCDIMVEGLAKHLRCVGIDAAIPSSKKPEPRQLIDQAYKEKRVILTRDTKLLKHQYLIRNQVYSVKNLLKNDQLLEVIETFDLKVCERQLMSRCTKCNGRFIQKPLTIEEAVAASRGFQVIPNCLFNQDLEFWQCTDCNQLYWEGTQYHNAVQKFIDVCKLKG